MTSCFLMETPAWMVSPFTICCPVYQLTCLTTRIEQCDRRRCEHHCLELVQTSVFLVKLLYTTCIGGFIAGQECMISYPTKYNRLPCLTEAGHDIIS
jgi:hypothetical protein